MPLRVHRSERADALVTGLADLLVAGPSDPFTPDVVAVPSKGVERWIAQSLSSVLGAGPDAADGVCANVLFPSPGRVVREALTAGSGIAADEDPWAESRLVWALLEVIDACAGEDWCVTLGRHLGVVDGGRDRGRRLAVAQKLAALFTSYGAQRPLMLGDWQAGRDTDGDGRPLDPDHAWQAELWRRLREHIGVESPAERLEPACASLRGEPGLVDLPERFSLFGPTRLTTAQLHVFDALAAHREVHLWLPHPSHGLWDRLADPGRTTAQVAPGQGVPAGEPVPTRRTDLTAELPVHPLVRSLAKDARELEIRLRAHTSIADDEHLPDAPRAMGGPTAAGATAAVATVGGTTRATTARTGGDSLLTVLQCDIHADRAPTGDHPLAEGDRSLEVHACHGRQRQVEVLRETLLGLLADDPSLELRDIVVMCPDIESYAPLINATFGLSVHEDTTEDDPGDDNGADTGGVHPGHRLTVRLADRSLRQTNPVLGVAARLLELADSRLTASEVLDLAAMPPVRRRFHLDEDALERVGDWVRRSGVRWGLDAEARRRYGLEQVRQNTWQAGLDRLLVGVTMDEDDLRTLDLALPLDDVDSTEIDLAGRLAELLDRLAAAVVSLDVEQALEAWVDALADAVESLTDVAPRDAWQVTQTRWLLADALTSAEGRAAGTRLRLADVRALLGDRLKGRPTRANFRTGHLTMCTMVPMRSVPHRVVCLLGLDDGVFPRGARIDGDDVLARNPRVGERDPKAEDRQLFLDAILAAQERLVVLYTGADERTGVERPPAVPLGELLDVLDHTAHVPDGRVRDRVLVRHPLQPFDARNFMAGELVGAGAFSFDRASYDGTRALLGDRLPRPAFLDRPLPAVEDPGDRGEHVDLDSLVRFLEHPVKGFLKERLGISVLDDEDEPSDALPVAPDALEKWAVGNRLLEAGLAGIPAERAVRAEWLRGQLPPGRLGKSVVDAVVAEVGPLIDGSAALRSGEAEHLDVSVELPSGVTLTGTVPGVFGYRIVRIVYSKLAPKHRLRAWAQYLALTAQWPEREFEAVTAGRGSKGGVALAHLSGVSAEDARRHLDALVQVYRAGLTAPLPLAPKTSCAYAEKRGSGLSPENASSFAGRAWRTGSGPNEHGEFSDAEHRRVWGEVWLPGILDRGPDILADIWPDEPHVFGRLARQVWAPLLEAEVGSGS